MHTNSSVIGAVVLVVSLLMGIAIARRGGVLVSEELRPQLDAAWRISATSQAIATIVCLWLGSLFSGIGILGGFLFTIVWAFAILPRFNRSAWPTRARQRLIVGNLIIALGLLVFIVHSTNEVVF